MLGEARVADAPQTVLAAADFGVALIGLQRVAAGRHERDRALEGGAVEISVREGGRYLAIKPVVVERCGAGHAENVLRQHVQCAVADRRRVLGAEIVGLQRRASLQHLEPVGGNQNGPGRFVEAMVGAPDPLRQPAGALRRSDVDHQIDVAPVDPQIKRRGADDRAQPALGHGRLDLAPLAGVERTVMKGDRQIVAVGPPQFLED